MDLLSTGLFCAVAFAGGYYLGYSKLGLGYVTAWIEELKKRF